LFVLYVDEINSGSSKCTHAGVVVGSEISVQEWQPVGKINSQYKKNDLSLVIKIFF